MKVKELERLLSYFSGDIDVIVEDRNGENTIEIDDVIGCADDRGKFSVRLLHDPKEAPANEQ